MATSKPWSGRSVVIIDDSAAVRDDLRRTYEAVGMRVVGTAENGVSGLAAVREHRPDLVSLDVIMPEMDGIECYRKLRDAFPEQKVVMVTWLGAEAKILDNLKDLIPSHLFQAKPVSVADLEQRLELVWNPALAAAKVAAAKPVAKSPLDEAAALIDLGVKVS